MKNATAPIMEVTNMNSTRKTNPYVCGFCITSDHDKCKQEPTYEGKQYKCGCFCRNVEYSDEVRDRMIEEFYGR